MFTSTLPTWSRTGMFPMAFCKRANNSELLILPGETSTLKWVPDRPGVFPMYCTDFCSALHQEMQGYVRVSPSGTNTALKFSTGE
jgi:nitrous-oxide reductase